MNGGKNCIWAARRVKSVRVHYHRKIDFGSEKKRGEHPRRRNEKRAHTHNSCPRVHHKTKSSLPSRRVVLFFVVRSIIIVVIIIIIVIYHISPLALINSSLLSTRNTTIPCCCCCCCCSRLLLIARPYKITRLLLRLGCIVSAPLG